MRKTRFFAGLLATSAIVSPAFAADMTPLLKAPARPAVAPISGYLEMEGGFAWQDNRNGHYGNVIDIDSGYSGTNNKWLFNGAGRVNWWVGPNLSTQFDVWGGVDDFGRGSNSGSSGFNNGVIANINLGGHFSYRIPEQYLVGVFGAVGGIGSNANSFCSPACTGGAAFTHGTLGLEGQWYSGPITLYGQGGVQTNLSNGDAGGNYNAWFVRAVGRYFLNENLRLEATAFYTQGWSNDGEDFVPTFAAPGGLFGDNFKMQQFAWGFGVEKKFDASPFALFARYAGAWTKFSNSFDSGYAGTFSSTAETTEHAFKVGFRLYLNEQTLKYNDRMGTTLDIVDPMTSAYRSFGRTWNCTTGCNNNL
jgi:hypothetical protein